MVHISYPLVDVSLNNICIKIFVYTLFRNQQFLGNWFVYVTLFTLTERARFVEEKG